MQKKSKAKTYGYAVIVEEDDLDTLDLFEGALMRPPKYKRKWLKINILLEGQYHEVDAIAYISTSRTYNKPSMDYKRATARTISQFWTGSDGKSIRVGDIPNR